jgi:hypothetical protein
MKLGVEDLVTILIGLRTSAASVEQIAPLLDAERSAILREHARRSLALADELEAATSIVFQVKPGAVITDFYEELLEAEQRSELAEPAKAKALLKVAIAIMDRVSLHHFGQLATAKQVEGILNLAFAELRAQTGNAATPKGGIQA